MALRSPSGRIRVLFVAESITAAQVVRLAALASALPRAQYDVHFASGAFPPRVFEGLGFTCHPIQTLSGSGVAAALEAGEPLYDKRTLLGYVDAERGLIERIEPDLCVGDFRWSLSSSAEKCGVPSASLINAYWSPYAVRPDGFPLPDHKIIRVVGEARARQFFPKALPLALSLFARPLNATRRALGLSEVGDLLEVLCHGTYTLYPDDPRLVPVVGAPRSHRFLGHVPWEPVVPMPDLTALGTEPLVYVTLGSSGKIEILELLLEALASLPVRVLLATAGRAQPKRVPPRALVTTYVPGSEASRQSALVISNGGSTTGYQALAEGTPVLGLPSNFDQFLATQAIVRAGAGLEVKPRSASREDLCFAIERGLHESSLRAGAQRVKGWLAQGDGAAAFVAFVREATLGARPSQAEVAHANDGAG